MKNATLRLALLLTMVLLVGSVLSACLPAPQGPTSGSRPFGTTTVPPAEPTTAPTEPTTEPTEPTTEPTEPATEPTEPATEPTEPTTEPTEPATEPTEPTTEPTESTTAPTEPDYPKAPNVTVFDANGREVELSSYFGKPIVLNFWASWCGPCRYEMPSFQKLYEEMGHEVQFLMVNYTAGDRKTDVEAFLKQYGYTFPVLFDMTGYGGYVYGLEAFPTTYFIDAQGNLVHVQVGAMEEAALRYFISLIK